MSYKFDFAFLADKWPDFVAGAWLTIQLTILSIAPSIVVMMTSFTRIIIVFHFLRQALGLQTTPTNQTLIGLALTQRS